MKKLIDPNWKVLRKLSSELQRCWLYIWDKCDAAGVYHFDADYINVDLKLERPVTIDELGALPECDVLPGDRVIIKNFIQVNNNGILKPGYNPHKPIFRAIEKNGFKNFAGLGIIIEIGKKEDKQEATFEAWFKLENKKFKLVDEDIDEGEDEGEDIKGVQGENNSEVFLWTDVVKKFHNDFHWKEKFCREKNIRPPDLEVLMKEWLADIDLKEDYKTLKELKNHFTNWYNKNKNGAKFNNKTGPSAISDERFAARTAYANRDD